MTDAAIIFDLDDTLFKERDYVESVLRVLAQESGSPSPTLPADGKDVTAAAARAIDTLAESAALPVEEILRRYRCHTPTLEDTEGAAATLCHLKENGYTPGILTDGRPATQRAKIVALGLSDIVSPGHIFISGETDIAKPDPRAWQAVAETIAATHYIYVGDNPAKDFAVPRALGWYTIGITDDGRNIHRQDACDASHDPDIWVASLADIPETLELL